MRLNSIVSTKIDLLGSRTATFPSILDGQYTYAGSMHSSGTTALTSAVISLLKAHYPTWSNDQIINQLLITAINKDDYNTSNNCNFDFTGLIGHGLVDADYALSFDGTVDRDLIWNKELKIYHNINVQSGKTLTIKPDTYLEFQNGKTFNVSGNLIVQGNLTINQSINILNGGNLEILPGAKITFTNNHSIVINGTLGAVGTTTNPIIFTSQSGTTSNSWGTITFSGSGASGSTIKYAKIKYGSKIEAINTSNITIQYCSIDTTYEGIRFNNSTGSVLNNTITTNSVGHGIVAENSSYLTVNNNIITKTYSSRRGVGIYYGGGSGGRAASNDIYGWDWGMCAIWSSSPSSFNTTEMEKNNRVRNCNTGLTVYRLSYPEFGNLWVPELCSYNSISNNSYNARVGTYYPEYESKLYAYYDWWGSYPPNTNLFQVGYSSYFYYTPFLDADPWGGVCLK